MTSSLSTLGIRGTLIIVLVSVVAFASSLRSDASGFTFATQGLNLKIDSRAVYNGVLQPGSTWALKNLVPGVDKFFNLSDVKPGDTGTTTISFHVNKDAWICLDFENLKQYENGRNEPELLEDASGALGAGELAAGTEFFAWYDDGDGSYEVGELSIFGTSTVQSTSLLFNNKTYALADATAGAAFPANQTKYVALTWCAGNLSVNTATAVITCDGTTLGNAAQTDAFSFDVGFRAVPKKDNKNFTCKKQGNTCNWGGCNTGRCNVTVNVNNSGTITSTSTSSSNTGGNSAGSGGSVVTGNASSTVNVTNILNQIRLLFGR